MVPHARILTAIALVARCSGDEAHLIDVLTRLYSVRFPTSLLGERSFWHTQILDKLPIELQVAIETTPMSVTGDFTPVFDAAAALGIGEFVTLGQTLSREVNAESIFVTLPAEILEWRRNPTARMALECLLLCNVPVSQAAGDMKLMFGRTFDEVTVGKFHSLFADRSLMRDWMPYSMCIPSDELQFKHRLTMEPVDFVRWKLGVPVQLDNEMVIDRLMSEAYFTERMIKHDARSVDPHGLPMLGQTDLARLKLERDTVFKCLDRKIKLREVAAVQSSGNNSIHREIAAIKLEFTAPSQPLMSELTDG